MGRTQEIIYLLADLVRRQRLAPLKVYVDSPMANAATRITLAHRRSSTARPASCWRGSRPTRTR